MISNYRWFRTIAAIAIGAMGIGTGAYAGEQAATGAKGTEALEEVIVTGSRIATPNAKSTSPIQVVSAHDIQVSGKSDISDIINQLPQNFNNDMGQDLGNRTSGLTTAGGVATADLRGLGPNRTLVLVNGRRLGQGSPYTFIQQPAPDLDQIPAPLVERIEVVTGGASATYGSDAIAGVVNFIMKKDFQGLQIDGTFGENWHDNHNTYAQGLVRAFGETPLTGTSTDGQSRSISVLAGANLDDGRGNVAAYFSYLNAEPVSSGQRDFGQCQMNESLTNGVVDGAVCGGSSNSNFFNPLTGPGAGTGPYSVLGTDFVPRGSAPTTPPRSFNSQKYIYMSRGDQRYTAGFMAHYDYAEFAKPYTEFSFMDDRSHQQIAPTALFRSSNPNDLASNNYYTNCSNPLLSAQQTAILCTPAMIAADLANPGSQRVNIEIGRRNVEGGGRSSDYQHTNYRSVFGVKGDITSSISYDAYGQYYYVSFYNSNNKYFNFGHIDNALLVTRDASGNPVCISGPPCVPYNIFADGGVAEPALQYLNETGTGQGNTTLRTVHADITAHLGDYGVRLPTATEGVALNIGIENRNENVTFHPDSSELSGQLAGFGSAAVVIDNSQSVKEQFIEARVPILQDRTGARDLVFDTGYRRSDYSTTGAVNTYKFEVQYAPIDGLQFRASYQRAIRAASIIELYNPQLVGLIQLGNDPCAPSTDANNILIPAQRSLQDCLKTVPAAEQAQFTSLFGNGGTTNRIPQAIVGQLSQLQGGNPRLTPESGTSYTYGVTFRPQALPTLTGSIDYWHIKLQDSVGVIPANAILNNCLNTGDPKFCELLVRHHNTGSLVGTTIAGGGYIVQTNVNTGAVDISGVDLQLGYKLDLPAKLGSLAFAMNGAYLLDSKTTPFSGGHTYDCAGLFGSTCQTINPKWRHNLRTTWLTPWDVTASLTWRYIGSVKFDSNDPDPTLHFAVVYADGSSGYDAFNAQLPAMSYLDLSAAWTVSKQLEVRGGINNFLDKDPPLATTSIVSGGAANTYSTYDSFGRQLFAAFTLKL